MLGGVRGRGFVTPSYSIFSVFFVPVIRSIEIAFGMIQSQHHSKPIGILDSCRFVWLFHLDVFIRAAVSGLVFGIDFERPSFLLMGDLDFKGAVALDGRLAEIMAAVIDINGRSVFAFAGHVSGF